MKKFGRRHLILIFIFAGLFLAALSQLSFNLYSQTKEKPLQYEVEVVLIEIPLYVVDKEGNPVKDLKASVVREYPVARRQFLLFFDFAFATPGRIVKAREACLNFIKELPFH
jgi:hypothetical protein